MVLFLIAAVTYFISIKPIPSTFLSIMAAILFLTSGISWFISDPNVWSNVIVGTVFAAIGVYLLIMEAVSLFKGGK